MSTAAGLATRERLLAAARELIEQGGYGSASVVAIADRAGVAAGTLYRHFVSKEELFLEVFRDVCAGEERAMRAAADDAPARARWTGSRPCWRRLRGARSQNRSLAWALLAEPVDPQVDAERLAYRERYASLVAAELRAAVDARRDPAAGRGLHRRGAGRGLR